MIAITNLAGETFLLNGIKQIHQSRKVNGEKTVNFLVVPTDANEKAFAEVNNESTFNFKNETYVIKKVAEKNAGNMSIKSVEAVHVFFDDMINSFQYNQFTGSQTFAAALTRVFENTEYNFSIVDPFTAKSFENFGRDNCLALFKNVLERYEAEFEVIGKQVYLKQKIGIDAGYQLRWKSNIKAIDKEVDTSNLSTVIKGFGGTPDETTGVYPVQREYQSNVELYGERHAPAVYDESTSTDVGMDARLIRDLIDEPQLSITVDIATIDGQVRNEGDRGFIIYEPMNIKVEARAVELSETYEYEPLGNRWYVVKTSVTLSNFKNRLTDTITRFGQTAKQVDRLFEGNASLPYNVLPEAMRIAAEAINNSLTEVQYPAGQGIVLQDPNNPNNMVRLTSAGIGLSTDGGETYRSALTGAGIVTNELVAGVIRTNNIQIVGEDDLFFWDGQGLFAYNRNDLTKYVKLNSDGLYIAKGAITIERPDGFKTINNGMSVFDVNIQEVEPAFHSGAVTEVQKGYATWRATKSTLSVDFNQYSFEHKARYLNVRYRILADPGNTAHIELWKDGEIVATAYTAQSNEYSPGVLNGFTLTVDLGTPTGLMGTFQIRMRSEDNTKNAYVHVTRKWLNG